MTDKLRVLWISDLVTPTGFSRVAHSNLKYIGDRLDFTGIGVNYFGDPHSYPLKIYPASTGAQGMPDLYGAKRLLAFAEQEFDLIFILNDAWILNEYLQLIKEKFKTVPKIITYFPVDAEEHDVDWYTNFDVVTQPVVYTEFGKAVVEKAQPLVKPIVIPHGVDTDIFYRINEDNTKTKRALFEQNKELWDSFIFLNANRNQPRKKLDITMEGFSIFAKDKPKNVRLYMHAGVQDTSVDITRLARRFDIEERLILTNLNKGVQRVPDEKLNMIYNACDVGVNTGLGEGWGLTNIEHAITGAPQIVPNHSACKEVFEGCSIVTPANIKITFDNIMTVGRMTTPEDVAEGMEQIYSNKDLYKELSAKSIEKFSRPEYQWETIANQWYALFEEVANR